MEPGETQPYIDHPYEIQDIPLSANLGDFDANVYEIIQFKLKSQEEYNKVD